MNAQLLKQWRKTNNLSQAKLATYLAIPQSTIARWETEFCKIEHPVILGLALKEIERILKSEVKL